MKGSTPSSHLHSKRSEVCTPPKMALLCCDPSADAPLSAKVLKSSVRVLRSGAFSVKDLKPALGEPRDRNEEHRPPFQACGILCLQRKL